MVTGKGTFKILQKDLQINFIKYDDILEVVRDMN